MPIPQLHVEGRRFTFGDLRAFCNKPSLELYGIDLHDQEALGVDFESARAYVKPYIPRISEWLDKKSGLMLPKVPKVYLFQMILKPTFGLVIKAKVNRKVTYIDMPNSTMSFSMVYEHKALFGQMFASGLPGRGDGCLAWMIRDRRHPEPLIQDLIMMNRALVESKAPPRPTYYTFTQSMSRSKRSYDVMMTPYFVRLPLVAKGWPLLPLLTYKTSMDHCFDCLDDLYQCINDPTYFRTNLNRQENGHPREVLYRGKIIMEDFRNVEECVHRLYGAENAEPEVRAIATQKHLARLEQKSLDPPQGMLA